MSSDELITVEKMCLKFIKEKAIKKDSVTKKPEEYTSGFHIRRTIT